MSEIQKYRSSPKPCVRNGDLKLISKIEKLKPQSIFEVLSKDFFRFDINRNPAFIVSQNCYEWYFAIGKYFKPKSILEIGVRHGYSLGSFLKGAHGYCNYYEGWDIEEMGSSNKKTEDLLREQNIDINGKLLHVDSTAVKSLDRNYDLIMVDGCHQLEPKLNDLNLALNYAKVLIMDDCDENWEPVLRKFIDDNNDRIKRWCFIDSFTGTGVVEFKKK